MAITTAEFITRYPGFDAETKALLLAACSTRGKYKGSLRAKAPSRYDNVEGFIAWTAIAGNLAPARLSVWGLMGLSADESALYTRLDKHCTVLCAVFNATEPPLRWNLWAYHHDTDAARARIVQTLDDMEAADNA